MSADQEGSSTTQTQIATRESAPLGGGPAGVSDASLWAGAAMVLGALLVAYAMKRKVIGKVAGKKEAAPAAQPGAAVDAELIRDMKELTERLAVELDRKAERLEKLIAAADERILRLEGTVRAETRVVEVKPEARRREVSPLESVHREVYELADAGLTPVEIAKKLDQPTGHIELILNLRKGTVAL
jgi:hypothetical protein